MQSPKKTHCEPPLPSAGEQTHAQRAEERVGWGSSHHATWKIQRRGVSTWTAEQLVENKMPWRAARGVPDRTVAAQRSDENEDKQSTADVDKMGG